MSFFHQLFTVILAKYHEFSNLVWAPFSWPFKIMILSVKFGTGYEERAIWTYNLYFLGVRA